MGQYRSTPILSHCSIVNMKGIFVYEYGRHTYFTNVIFNPNNIYQKKDNIQNICNCNKYYREGGLNVHNVIDYWLKVVNS